MSKLEEFKKFIATIPTIKEDVLSGRYTWQQLYEIYDMYGEDDKFWKAYEKGSNGPDFSVLTEIIKSIDLNVVSNGLQALEKVLNMASGFLVKEEPKEQPNQNQKNRWYDE